MLPILLIGLGLMFYCIIDHRGNLAWVSQTLILAYSIPVLAVSASVVLKALAERNNPESHRGP
jgi:hypothetical protein